VKHLWPIAAFACVLSGGPALSAPVTIEAVPRGWRMQDYAGSALAVFFTGSSCVNGALTVPSSASEEEKIRFWNLIWNAKRSGQFIGIIYDNSTSNCNIQSFYIP
jgi:hypothetical protein